MSRELLEQIISIRNMSKRHIERGQLVPTHSGRSLNAIRDILAKSLPEIEDVVPRATAKWMFLGRYQASEVEQICRQLLPYARMLRDRARQDAEVERVVPPTKDIFLIHGHDDGNLQRVRTILRDRFGLNPIILSEQAAKGRSIIEKFEDEAGSASFAIALLTPDDLVSAIQDYKQARPNVVFELGWFYGRLGRHRVCILCKKGTAIHSDLHGILRVEFATNVEEGFIELERELRAARLVV